MIRNLTIVAVASFVLFIGCFAGAFAIGGRDIFKHGWSVPGDWNLQVSDDNDHIRIGPGRDHVEDGDDGDSATRQISWSGSDALQIDVPAEVIFTQAAPGAGAAVKVTGPKRLVDRVTLENGRLALRDDDGEGTLTINGHGFHISGDSDRLSIEITAPAVRAFTLNGSGDLYLKAYDQPDLALEINGSGDVYLTSKPSVLTSNVAGSGEVHQDW
jgi:hypothetical protein